jgi:shikimate kinase
MKKQINLILVGYRCSGKTSVGKIIAQRTGMGFYDTDNLIEKRAGRSVGEIVAGEGWDGFREIEEAVVRDASELKNSVIATGGGVIISGDNIRNLKRSGYLIWLEGDADILMKRMEKDNSEGRNRPSLTGCDPVEETKKVLEIRNPLYLAAADLVINTDRLSLEEIAERVLEAFSSQRSAFS